MRAATNSVNVSAGGAFLAQTGSEGVRKSLAGARLTAGAAAAATLTIQETDGSGRILYSLAAPQGAADEATIPVQFTGNIFVTIAGAGAVGHVFVP